MQSPRHAPVVVMRPFPNGAGYAYDETIDQPTLTAVSRAFSPIFQQPAGQTFNLTLPDGRCLLGDKIVDTECLDPLARERQPAITRGMILDRVPSPRQEVRLRRALVSLPLPEQAGPHSGLHLRLPQPIQVPEPTLRIGCPTGTSPALLLTGLLGVEAALAFLLPPANPVAWVLRGLAYTGAFWVAFQRPEILPTREQLTDLERRFLGEETGHLDLAQAHADRATLTLDGVDLSLGFQGQPPRGGPRPPQSVSEPNYKTVIVSAGMVLLRGEEWVEWEGEPAGRCSFQRCYRRGPARWQLQFAQWQRPGRTGSTPEVLDAVLAETPRNYREVP